MTSKTLIHFIWDFPIQLFNMARTKIMCLFLDCPDSEVRWLNG